MSLRQMAMIQQRRRGGGWFVKAYREETMNIQERLVKAVEDYENASLELMSAKIDALTTLNRTDANKAIAEAYLALARKKGAVT